MVAESDLDNPPTENCNPLMGFCGARGRELDADTGPVVLVNAGFPKAVIED